MWLLNSQGFENMDPNPDETMSSASSRSLSSLARTDLLSTFSRRSDSGTSSTSSKRTRRQIEEEVEARLDARVKRLTTMYEEKLAAAERKQVLAVEAAKAAAKAAADQEHQQAIAVAVAAAVKKQRAAEKKQEVAEIVAKKWEGKYHNRLRTQTKWRVQAGRAKKSALRNHWAQVNNASSRARTVLVQKGAKRRAIQSQVVFEPGSLQPRKSGGTEYTTRERLDSWLQDSPSQREGSALATLQATGVTQTACEDRTRCVSSCTHTQGAAAGATIQTRLSTCLSGPQSERSEKPGWQFTSWRPVNLFKCPRVLWQSTSLSTSSNLGDFPRLGLICAASHLSPMRHALMPSVTALRNMWCIHFDPQSCRLQAKLCLRRVWSGERTVATTNHKLRCDLP